MPLVRRGSKGPDVSYLQTRLKELGFGPKEVDAVFGPDTQAALIAFQKSKGLPADGIAGPNTLAALDIELTKTYTGPDEAGGSDEPSSSKASSPQPKSAKSRTSKARTAKARTSKGPPGKTSAAKTSAVAATDRDTEDIEGRDSERATLSLAQLLKSQSDRLSVLCVYILRRAGQMGNRREHHRDQVTSSCIFFAAVELGAETENPTIETASQFLYQWMNEGERSRQYSQAFHDFMGNADLKRETGFAQVSSNTTQLIETAGRIASFVRKVPIAHASEGIHARDLVGALLFTMARDARLGAVRRLENAGFSLEELRHDYFNRFLDHEKNPDDDIAKWRQVIIDLKLDDQRKVLIDLKPSLPSIDADTPSLKDHLNIASEVRGFANIIAARAVSTPLSIGLFGDWGSGKSTFMEQLQAEVKRISEGVRNRKLEEETSFLGNIVQIRFNAWHYAEANLWASLVSHVFDNLSFSEEDEERKAAGVRKDLLLELVTNLATEKVAETELQTKTAEVKVTKETYETAKIELDGAQRGRDVAKLGLSQVLAQGIWPFLRRILDKDPVAKSQIDEARKVLGKAGLTEEEVKREIEASRTTLGQLQLRFSSLMSDPSRKWKLGAILIVTILIPIVLTFAVALVAGSGVLERVVASLTPLVTLIGGALLWLRTGRKGVDAALNTLKKAEQQLDELYARAQSEQDEKLQSLRDAVAQKETEIEEARKKRDKAKTEVVRTVASLKELEPARVLEKFVQERAASKDYRKLLGVVALIRRDFKNLSDMLRKQDNKQLREAVTDILKKDKEQKAAAAGAGDAGVDAASETPVPTVVPEPTKGEVDAKLEEYRIDRIVLYIDDLDRCPPKQVVDVLQAIHLLLAFELFVVVVGVDARWIRHSLRERFPEMLSEDWDEGNAPENGERQVKMATPRDYVEKIFQVPFWLKPMDTDAAEKLLTNLIPENQLLPTTQIPANGGGKSAGGAQAPPTPAGHASGDSKPDSAPTPDPGTPPAGGAESNKPDGDAGTGKTAEPGTGEPPKGPDLVLKPESLLLDVKERDAMIKLSRVIGKTPRTLKRFVNVYRIIKAGLDGKQLAAFMGTGQSDAQYPAVLVLLAIAHGAPDVAPAFFFALKQKHEEATANNTGDIGLKGLLQHMKLFPPTLDESLALAWSTLIRDLQTASAEARDLPVAELREWLPVVVRYTFQLGRLSEEVANPKAAQIVPERQHA